MQVIYNDISHLGEALEGATKVFVVCDSSYPFLNIKSDIENMGKPHVLFSDFTPNPLYEQVCKGVEMFNDHHCDSIVAVGGGSTIDVAKCIKLYCKMNTSQNYLQQECVDSGVPLIAIPTTAGTGSESTRYAVIYFEGKKQSVTHESIVPDYAVLEPMLLKTLPLYQKKCTLLDALCQGIESWWSVNSTDESKQYSQTAVKMIAANWRDYIFENSDAAAAGIMKAANFAGRAINITQTTAPHAMSYKITSMFGLPHGHAVAICLPEVWDYMEDHLDQCIDDRGGVYLKQVFVNIAQELDCLSVQDAIQKFREMLVELQIGGTKSSNKEDDIEMLTRSVNPIRLKNNPVKLSEDVIRMMYRRVLN
jgi:alcohol dehydrogenase class IV